LETKLRTKSIFISVWKTCERFCR